MDKKSSKQNKSSVEIAIEEIKVVNLIQSLIDYLNNEKFLNFKLWLTMEETEWALDTNKAPVQSIMVE